MYNNYYDDFNFRQMPERPMQCPYMNTAGAQLPTQTHNVHQPNISPIPGMKNIPTIPQTIAVPGTGTGAPDFQMEPGPPVQQDINYTAGFLTTQIGKYVKIEFLIGTNMIIDREGILLGVGISYVLIREAESDDVLVCDIYSIKFVKIYY